MKQGAIIIYFLFALTFSCYSSYSTSPIWYYRIWYKRWITPQSRCSLAQIYSWGKQVAVISAIQDPTRPLCLAYATMEINIKAQTSPDTITTCHGRNKLHQAHHYMCRIASRNLPIWRCIHGRHSRYTEYSYQRLQQLMSTATGRRYQNSRITLAAGTKRKICYSERVQKCNKYYSGLCLSDMIRNAHSAPSDYTSNY